MFIRNLICPYLLLKVAGGRSSDYRWSAFLLRVNGKMAFINNLDIC